jgi:hypothetical protein
VSRRKPGLGKPPATTDKHHRCGALAAARARGPSQWRCRGARQSRSISKLGTAVRFVTEVRAFFLKEIEADTASLAAVENCAGCPVFVLRG